MIFLIAGNRYANYGSEFLSFYRAALAAACQGDLTTASRLVRCSVAFGEDAPSAAYLYELLQGADRIGADTLGRLRALFANRKYVKALFVRLPDTAKAHTIRGLLFARLGFRRAARYQFALALSMDTGNDLAKAAIAEC